MATSASSSVVAPTGWQHAQRAKCRNDCRPLVGRAWHLAFASVPVGRWRYRKAFQFLAVSDPASLGRPAVVLLDPVLNFLVRCHGCTPLQAEKSLCPSFFTVGRKHRPRHTQFPERGRLACAPRQTGKAAFTHDLKPNRPTRPWSQSEAVPLAFRKERVEVGRRLSPTRTSQHRFPLPPAESEGPTC